MLGKDEAILEGWTVLSALAGVTTRAKLGMIHMAHYFRHPALTAKMPHARSALWGPAIHFSTAATTAGVRRLWLAVARGDGRSHRRSGGSHRTDPAALGRRGPVTFRGRTWEVTDAICRPKPLQQPRPPLWFGEAAPGGLAAAPATVRAGTRPRSRCRSFGAGLVCFARPVMQLGGTWRRSS